MGSADFTTSHGNPAEDGFITVTEKTHGDIWALKSSEKKRVKTKALFVSRCTPDVSGRDAENSLKEQLKLSSTACTKLKTKFSTYAFLQVFIN
jgi:hypothetical protein